MRSVYFCLMRSASAFLFSKGCSSLNLDFILMSQSNSIDYPGREWKEGPTLLNEIHERVVVDVVMIVEDTTDEPCCVETVVAVLMADDDLLSLRL